MGRKFLKRSKLVRLVLAFLPILVFGGLVHAGAASAATYYISPSGSDSSAGTISAPWRTFSHAMGILSPGDTLYLEDGTYTINNAGSGSVVLYVRASGNSSSRITIKALNDGNAVIDGQGNYVTCQVAASYVEIDGINFRNSGNGSGWSHGIEIWGGNDILRRDIVNKFGMGFSGTVAGASENNSMGIEIDNSAVNTLVEDCAVYVENAASAYTTIAPRVGINVYGTGSVIRRNFIYWQPGNNSIGPSSIQIYSVSNVLVENNVIVDNGSGTDGILFWGHYNGLTGERAYGNITRNMSSYGIWITVDSGMGTCSGTIFKDNVVLNNYGYPLRNGGDTNMTIENNTVEGAHNAAILVANFGSNSYNLATYVSGNSAINNPGWESGGLTGDSQNNLYSSGSGSGSDSFTNPNYDYSTYGLGAYLIPSSAIGDRGANALYEYVNGMLTSSPLWPWPMESRIQSELGMSVTWASNGGIWQTLNGVYPAGTTSSLTSTGTTSGTASTGSTSGTTAVSTGSTSVTTSTSTGSASGSTTTSTGSTSGTTTTGSTSGTTTTSTSSGTGSITNSTSGSTTATSGSVSPLLVSPSQGEATSTTVTFTWEKPENENPYKYRLLYSKNSDLSNASPVDVAYLINSRENDKSLFAGLGVGLLPFGLVFPAGIVFTNKKKRLLLIAALLFVAAAFSSCGGAGTQSVSSGSASTISYTVSNLDSRSTYYWAVQAVDSNGQVISQSPTSNFQTQ
ncbi:MAG: hypothetical protein M0Z52_09350 [Actinomycetota bacterium]|nr:hypothetical protein [Actinomycetota bacterium]